MNIGQTLYDYRTSNHLDMATLSELLEITEQWYYKIENCNSVPSCRLAMKMCQLMDLSPAETDEFLDTAKQMSLESLKKRMQPKKTAEVKAPTKDLNQLLEELRDKINEILAY